MPQFPIGNIPDDSHPKISAVVDYWKSIHPPGALPGRQHFDPIDIPKLLANVSLIEVHGRPPRFKCSVAGTALAVARGKDFTGKWYDELFGDFEDTGLYQAFMHVIEHREPSWRRGFLRLPRGRDFQGLERVHLPMARDGSTVDMILSLTVFIRADDPFMEKVRQTGDTAYSK